MDGNVEAGNQANQNPVHPWERITLVILVVALAATVWFAHAIGRGGETHLITVAYYFVLVIPLSVATLALGTSILSKWARRKSKTRAAGVIRWVGLLVAAWLVFALVRLYLSFT